MTNTQPTYQLEGIVFSDLLNNFNRCLFLSECCEMMLSGDVYRFNVVTILITARVI